ncbi:MAG TPA: YihY/virulence factor BrkB family protein [Mariniphaga anaerophila]|uniref:YihY/virulence factor BrkB family protein n=1 Tax=Mariniphaga anaerophila TaxID=1484053 RepID=A0A831LC17_9BACT|nr:YihY/virulence factor BrkB family protein [Mariniphaga anaerophila]
MKRGLLNRDKYQKVGDRLIDRAQKISLPFFDGVPLYDVAVFFWRSIVDGSITTRASAIAFSFFIAFFPGVLFLFTLIPYIPIENFQNELFMIIQEVVPDSTFATIEDTVTDIIMRPRGGLLSLGFAMALVFSTNGLASMMSAFDATIHSINRRSWISQRLAAIGLLIILSVLLTAAIALITGGQLAISYLRENDILRDSFTIFLLNFGKWIVIIFLLFFANSFLYYMAPAKKTRWRFISAGSTLATVLSIGALGGFSYYINNFSQYNKLYGSIGTLLILLFLMYVMSVILLVGFELNASIYQARTQKEE